MDLGDGQIRIEDHDNFALCVGKAESDGIPFSLARLLQCSNLSMGIPVLHTQVFLGSSTTPTC